MRPEICVTVENGVATGDRGNDIKCDPNLDKPKLQLPVIKTIGKSQQVTLKIHICYASICKSSQALFVMFLLGR